MLPYDAGDAARLGPRGFTGLDAPLGGNEGVGALGILGKDENGGAEEGHGQTEQAAEGRTEGAGCGPA